MKLAAVVDSLQRFAPLSWAEEWDHVGLLVEPVPAARHNVRRVLLTIDLTESVLEEAVRGRVDLIVAYHPPVFGGLPRLTQALPAARVAMGCVAKRIAVYAPHTALDAAPGGVNDWLADGLGAGARRVLLPRGEDDAGAGQGREVVLGRPVKLATVVRRIKAHLGLARVRVARAERHRRGDAVQSVRLCAGAGASVLAEASGQADVHWTGEMRHHDVLAALAAGTSVVLCEHSNTERGYLPRFAREWGEEVPGLEVRVATQDREPLLVD